MRLVVLFALFAACLHGLPAAAKAPYPFSVSTERNGRNHDLIARNRGPAPVSVRLTLPVSDNVSPTQALPFYAVVGPRSEVVLLTLAPADPGRGTRFSLQTTFQLGSYHAVPDPRATCRLPFADGISAVIGQAPGGPITSHATPDSEEAIDFTMPPHTPVVAARNGTVIETEASNLFGGQDRTLVTMANYVRILHEDGTIATYAHLSPGGVKVVAGQRVGAGTVIGASGATGYASGPHLHFVVQRLVRQNDGFAMVSVPVRFRVGNPPAVFVPRFGQRTTADYPATINEKRAAGAR